MCSLPLFEPAFIWFVPSEGSGAHSILIKAHGNILRSIISGSTVQLFCAVNQYQGEKHLCLALRVWDDAVHPSLIFKVQIEEEEHQAFWEILKRKSTPIFLFDELCHCVSWTESRFAEKGITEILKLVNSPKTLYAGAFNENAFHSTDCMNLTIDPSYQAERATTIEIIDLGLELDQFETWQIHNYSISESHGFEITEEEGNSFEQRIWAALESIFPFGIYRSPQFLKGEKKLELTDILCLSANSLILVEAKAMSVFTGNPEKSINRKVSNVQKQIDKALDQLEGAVKRIKNKSAVSKKKTADRDNIDRRINFTENQIAAPHAVVVVSELLQFGSWDSYFEKCSQLSKNNHALFQILDLSELMKIIVASSKSTYDPETMINVFDCYLIERFEAVMKSKNVLIKVKFDS